MRFSTRRAARDGTYRWSSPAIRSASQNAAGDRDGLDHADYRANDEVDGEVEGATAASGP